MSHNLVLYRYIENYYYNLVLCRYIGDNIKLLIERADGTYCFRLHKDRSDKLHFNLENKLHSLFRVYYVSEKIMKLGSNVARENLISLGTCFGSVNMLIE